MKDKISANIETYLCEQILQQPDREIHWDEPLISSGLIDSFSLVDMALYVEDTFGVIIDDIDLNTEKFNTINELTILILERQGG